MAKKSTTKKKATSKKATSSKKTTPKKAAAKKSPDSSKVSSVTKSAAKTAREVTTAPVEKPKMKFNTSGNAMNWTGENEKELAQWAENNNTQWKIEGKTAIIYFANNKLHVEPDFVIIRHVNGNYTAMPIHKYVQIAN